MNQKKIKVTPLISLESTISQFDTLKAVNDKHCLLFNDDPCGLLDSLCSNTTHVGEFLNVNDFKNLVFTSRFGRKRKLSAVDVNKQHFRYQIELLKIAKSSRNKSLLLPNKISTLFNQL